MGVQLKAKLSPFLTHSHCIAHRLALACGDALKDLPVLETFRFKFNSLFHLFTNSAIKTRKPEKIQELLNDPVLRIKEPHTVTWLSIRSAVYMCYPSVVAALCEIGE